MPQSPQESWINDFNNEFVKEGKLSGNHLILKDFISNLLQSERESMKQKAIACLPEVTRVSGDYAGLILRVRHQYREDLLSALREL